MKKWIPILLTVMLAGMIFWSCSDDDGGTEPSNDPPTCTITSPADDATFVIGNNITVNVDAVDADGNILEVRFYIDDLQKNTDQNLPYSYVFNTDTLNTGTHTIKVISKDNDGAETSSQINIILTTMVFISGGTFDMGDQNDGISWESPVHSVTVSDFYMGATEVTQSEWSEYMPAEDWSSYGTGDNYPAYYVSWYEIIEYCNLRSIAEGLNPCYSISSSTDPMVWGAIPTSSDSTWNAAICNWSANGYRLPSEAEWEYAARGGFSGQRFPNGATISHNTNGDTQANYYGTTSYTYDVSPTTGYHPDFNGAASPVGSFPANGYGLYDMAGNLWEWCWDWYSSSYYSTCNDLGTVSDPYGPTSGSYRVIRGGGWGYDASSCRVPFRLYYNPDNYYTGYEYSRLGFRITRSP